MGARADALQAEFTEFKDRVRAEALRAARVNGWCDSGLNESLRRLGLREKAQPVLETANVTVRQRVMYRVEPDASTEERERAAREQAGRHLVGEVIEVTLPERIETPAGVPQVGQPCPPRGAWYEPATVSGGPNQCRVSHDSGVYCTRALAHAADFHVASGRNAGVLAVWPAAAGDVRSDGGSRRGMRDYAVDDDDEDYDGDDD